ncbi:MAG: hypothetical protein SCALA702_22420 [Melioribacteraceae bacterium]|nr:MAG: hypothetical protein SCALA702_22420 [Melioribacteraceae bacterium]
MKFFIDSILFSYSQIFFSNRRWFGLIAILATFLAPAIGAMALFGVIISNLVALFLKFDKDKIFAGIYGFNGLLFGAGAAFYFDLTPFMIFLVVIFIIMTFFLSAVLENFFAQVFNLPGLSLPFVLSLYIFLIFLTNYDDVFYRSISFANSDILAFLPVTLQEFFKAFGIIFFQTSIISGVLLVIAVLLFSRVMFVNSIVAFALNYVVINIIFNEPASEMYAISAFNSILAAFALGGSLIILSRKTWLLLFVSTAMIIIFTGFFAKILDQYLLPVLVLPFNMVALSTIYSLKFRQEHTDFVLLYFQPGSPEENYYFHQNRKSRFDKFKAMFPELPFFGEWYITQGFEGSHTHKDDWKYAWDFEIKDEKDKLYSDEGKLKANYYCYNTPVASPMEGHIVRLVDNIPDNKIGDSNIKKNWGNTVIIDHGKGLFSSFSHLKPESIKVAIGEEVKKGQIIASCGNSGRSPVPHLHFQFQTTDKVGEKTYKFPIASYLEKKNGKYHLKTFDYPTEGSYVRNIETHKALKKAFDIKFGHEFVYEYDVNGTKGEETWQVQVDIQNNLYIENEFGAKAYFYLSEKVFYFTNFVGDRNCALYYFYLNAIRVPLGYIEDLEWEDEYPVSITIRNAIRYLSEFLLVFGKQLESKAFLTFREKVEDDEDFEILNKISHTGKGIFSFYKKSATGSILIDSEGFINSIKYEDSEIKFEAKQKRDEEN